MNYSSIQYKLPILMDYIFLMLKHIFFFSQSNVELEKWKKCCYW